MNQYDLVLVGGGTAGMAAAISAKENGVENILILEREEQLGGALNFCIHNGFGRRVLSEQVTGPEYAQFLIKKLHDLNIDYKLDSLVLELNRDRSISYVNPEEGIVDIKAKAVVIASGSREKFTGNINIPTNKFAGVYTVGAAQKFVNLRGYLPGKDIVIIGTSDITLVIARRLLLEGAKIRAIVEKKPYLIAKREGMKRIVDDFNLPVLFSKAVVDIGGTERIESVTIESVDENGRVIPGTKEELGCDCLLLSVGWLPENEFCERTKISLTNPNRAIIVDDTFKTSLDGVYACGNVVHSYSYADDTTLEGYEVGRQVAKYLGVIKE